LRQKWGLTAKAARQARKIVAAKNPVVRIRPADHWAGAHGGREALSMRKRAR
jgi:hypothetical protein